MTPLANFIGALANVLDIAINLMFLVLLARVVISWIQPAAVHPVGQVIYAMTEPVLHPIRRYLHKYTKAMVIDFSPIIAFLALIFIQGFVVTTLKQFALSLQM